MLMHIALNHNIKRHFYFLIALQASLLFEHRRVLNLQDVQSTDAYSGKIQPNFRVELVDGYWLSLYLIMP